jgi:hypothetical protein
MWNGVREEYATEDVGEMVKPEHWKLPLVDAGSVTLESAPGQSMKIIGRTAIGGIISTAARAKS